MSFSAFTLVFLLMAISCKQNSSYQDLQFGSADVVELLENTRQLTFQAPDSAISILNVLLDKNKNELTNREIMLIYSQKGVAYSNKGEFVTSDSLFLLVLQVVGIEVDTLQHAGTYISLGNNQRRIGNSHVAIEYYRRAWTVLADHPNACAAMDVIKTNMGTAFSEIGKTDSARYYIQLTLDNAVQREDMGREGIALQNLGILFFRQQEYSQAEQYLRKALSRFESTGNKRSIMIMHYNLAEVLFKMNRSDEAHFHIMKSDEMGIASGSNFNELGYVAFYGHQAREYLEAREYAKSLEMAEKALAISYEYAHSILIARSYYLKSTVYRGMKNYTQAIYYANKALEIAQEQNVLDLLIDIYDNLSFIYAAQGHLERFEQAVQARETHRNSIFTAEKFEIVQELQTRYEVTEKEQEIAMQKKIIRRNGLIVILLSIVCVAIVVIFAIVVRFQKKRLRNHIRLIQQNETLMLEWKKRSRAEDNNVPATLIDESTKKILQNLNRLFEQEKMYRIPKLTLEDVAERLNIQKSVVSNFINNYYQKNFNEFANFYRINEAKEILKAQSEGKYPDYTIQYIAESVGFSGRTQFYRAFDKEVGITPVEYKNTVTKIHS
jgi:tetratricopeptide (TPR) repeat protein